MRVRLSFEQNGESISAEELSPKTTPHDPAHLVGMTEKRHCDCHCTIKSKKGAIIFGLTSSCLSRPIVIVDLIYHTQFSARNTNNLKPRRNDNFLRHWSPYKKPQSTFTMPLQVKLSICETDDQAEESSNTQNDPRMSKSLANLDFQTSQNDDDNEDEDTKLYTMSVESSGKYTRKATWEDLNRYTGKEMTPEVLIDWIVNYQKKCFPEGV